MSSLRADSVSSASSGRDRVLTRRRKPKRTRVVNLALQGGGSHGAFTWGVLDRLLEEGRIGLEGISGTSAGAMNAVVLAHGLLESGRDGARDALKRFWESVALRSPLHQMPPNVTELDGVLGGLSQPLKAAVALTRIFSPYELNPFDLNPLRQIIAEQVDFERLRSRSELKLFIAATQVRTGKLRLFRTNELTLETLLASACLPALHHAIEIDGEAYWDGGYSANPAIFPLFYECDSPDVVVVLLHPRTRPEIPHTANEISNRVNELGFNSTFLREMQTIIEATEHSERASRPHGIELKLQQMRFHVIEAEKLMGQLAADSPMNAQLPFIRLLHDQGRAHADTWLKNNFRYIGERGSVDLAELFT